MKIKLIFFILSLVLIVLSISILTTDDIKTKVLSNAQVISIYHTNQREEISISLLTNNPEDFYFDSDYIVFSKLYNDEETLSLRLKKIDYVKEEYIYDKMAYFQVDLHFTLPFTASASSINMDDVSLQLDYDNGDSVTVFIGEFNYLFQDFNDEDLALSNLSASYDYIDGVETVSAFNIGLSNSSEDNINITGVKVISTDVLANYSKSIKGVICPYKDDVASCLTEEEYDPHLYTESSQIFFLPKRNNIDLFVPLVYMDDAKYLYRAAIVVSYRINGEDKEFIIDDFPFMSKPIYLEEMEDYYHEGVIISRSE